LDLFSVIRNKVQVHCFGLHRAAERITTLDANVGLNANAIGSMLVFYVVKPCGFVGRWESKWAGLQTWKWR
jgi:hypothetical protein